MWVHKVLDVFFRTLDAVDAARDKVDRALGREPRPDPWAVEWPPPNLSASPAERPAPDANEADAAAPPAGGAPEVGVADVAAEGSAPAASKARRARARTPSAAGKAATRGAPKKAPPKAGRTKGTRAAAAPSSPAPADKSPADKSPSSRKGSVDRQGKDFDSPRARAVAEYVAERGLAVVSEAADHGGKKVLARMLWSLYAAEAAGSEKGLTCADASALLHLAAGMEVFATNLARACRDHPELIEETEPDGRSKRYKLSAAGRLAAEALIAPGA